MALIGAVALVLPVTVASTASAQATVPVRDSTTLCPGAVGADFDDIAGSPHAENIRCLADVGIVRGKPGGGFDPNVGVRRDQMASVVVAYVEEATGRTLPGGEDDRFGDVATGNVHRTAINKLAASGWIQGRGAGVYDPAGTISRGQMARFIAGAVAFIDDGDGTNGSAPPAASSSRFSDVPGTTFAGDIDAIAAVGIVNGYADGTYRPNAPVLRGQVATFVVHAFDYTFDVGIGGPAVPSGFVQTSRFVTVVDAAQVTDGTDVGLGEEGATGVFDLKLDSVDNVICYAITLDGVSGPYQSPALTATHIHQNSVGETGPARVAFADPQPVDAGQPDGPRRSTGCVDGDAASFPSGAMDPDPGAGFDVAALEADPSGFYLDSHTAAFPAGAVRGQLGSTAAYDVALSWHDQVADDADGNALFGRGEPGASGSALLVVTDATDRAAGTADDAICAVISTDATGPFAGGPGAHLHAAARDANGPVVAGFATPDDAEGRSSSCTASFLEGFTPADLADDLEGYYVNVHSDAFPAGAVRGQLPFGTRIADEDVTSTVRVVADPDQVVGAGGQAGATATFDLTFDADAGVVCYEIRTDGVSGDDASPAVTATHIHEAPAGQAGPPRVAFADPVPVDPAEPDGARASSGCAVTPQFTGTATDGVDNGLGATLAEIEANLADYYVDVHTEAFAPGAVRGQLAPRVAASSVVPASADVTRTPDRPTGAGAIGRITTAPEGMVPSEFGCHFELA